MATISFGRCLWSDGGGCFDHLKRVVIIGPAFGFLVWFFAFMVVGGEWFSHQFAADRDHGSGDIIRQVGRRKTQYLGLILDRS